MNINDIDVNNAEQLYSNKANSQAKCARMLNISRTSFSNIVKKNNFPRRERTRKYYANDNFFSSWSHDMAYCLGFIAADGHVWEKRPYLSIAIHIKDVNVLEFIRDKISPDSMVRLNTNHNMVQLTIHSEQIWKDLQQYSITHKKTFEMSINFDIPKEFFGDYVRGFFDGDGSIFARNKRCKPYYWSSFVSASEQMLIDLQRLLGFGKVKSTHAGKYFVLEVNQKDSLKLKDIMYHDTTNILMKRKYDIFNKIDIGSYSTWSEEEDDIIIQSTGLKNRQLEQLLLNRTFDSIKARRSKLGCLYKR